MFNLIRKNLAARKLRLLITSFAVLLGVAFMAGTLVFTDTIGATFDNLLADVNKGTDGYIRAGAAFDDELLGEQRQRIDSTLVDTVSAVDGVAAAAGHIEAYAQLVGSDGELVGNPGMGAPVLGEAWIADDALNPFDLVDGRAPAASDEVVIDRASADDAGYAVGDRATVLTQAGPIDVTIVGLVTFGGADSPGGASISLFTLDAAERYLTEPGKIDGIRLRATGGVSQTELAARISAVVPGGVEVLTGDQLTKEDQQDVKDDMSFFNVFLLVFAGIALFVGSFIIYNSFSILVAQRRKEMALLRAIGAGRKQVMSSVMVEAGAVGLVASIAGLAVGVGVAFGLKQMLSAMGIDLPGGSLIVGTRTVVMSLIAGVGVSLASAVLPARRASKVPPVAALREVALDHSGSSRRRLVAGLTVTGGGVAAMAAGLFGGAGLAPVGLGAVLVFVGVAVLGPILARPLSRLIGAPLPRLRGVAGNLARENAMRNPKRTSTTAAALMIGVALVGFITILASSTSASVAESVDRTFTGDLVVTSGVQGIGGLTPDVAEQIAALPEIDAASGLRIGAARVDGAGAQVYGIDATSIQRIVDLDVAQGSMDQLGSGTIAVLDSTAEAHGWGLGTIVPVEFAMTGTQQLTIAAIFDEADVIGEYVVGLDTYEANVADQFDFEVLVNAAEGVSLDTAKAAVTGVTDGYPQATVQDREEYKQAQTDEIGMILNLIYALLGLAVFIALLGIANTLALSIFERTRELGLLRAIGMTRQQLRATVRWEAMIIALLGTTLGLTIGVGFGWAIVKALEDQGLGVFAVPGGRLGVITAIAALAGVGAAVLPARRAARLDVLGAITAE